MRIGSCVFALMVGTMLGKGIAAPFAFSVESGEALIKPSAATAWEKMSDGKVNFGDSLVVPAPHTAEIQLDSATTLLLKDSCTVVLNGTDSLVQLELLEGQVFLRHEEDGAAPFRINAGSCTFIPIGTAAAVKVGKDGQPRVAVLRGGMRMTAPDGKALDIRPGFFGTFNAQTGSLARQELPPNAVQTLTEWSGVQLERVDMPADDDEVVADRKTVSDTAQSVTDETEIAETASMPAEGTATVAQDSAEEVYEQDMEIVREESSGLSAKPALAEAGAEGQEVGAVAVSVAANTTTTERVMEDEEVQEERGADNNEEKAEEQAEEREQAEDAAVADQTAGTPPESAATRGEESTGLAPEGPAGKGREKDKPTWEIGAGTATVGDEQWTRIAFAVDVPIWRFGVCFDIELFLNAQGEISDKGWDFSEDNWAKSLARKIRYVRFNHPGDPVYARVMALDNVTFAYGFIVNGFSNMLNYPDEKLMGLQFELNNISPIGITFQTMVADFLEVQNDGGVVAGRLAVRPLKPTEVPILKRASVGVTYANDWNQYAPAREWDYRLTGPDTDKDADGIVDGSWQEENYYLASNGDSLPEIMRQRLIVNGEYDTIVRHENRWAANARDRYSILGFDVGVPLITSRMLQLDAYGHTGISVDNEDDTRDTVDTKGWGFGFPGVALTVGPLWARVEYRRIQGMFQPGYFDRYYLEERLSRNPITVKESSLEDATLNGVFGEAGMNVFNIFIASAAYQRLGKGTDPDLDQRFEANGRIGTVLLEKVPKLNMAEIYFRKTQIQRTVVGYVHKSDGTVLWDQPVYDQMFFERTPNTYWGYRLGVEVTPGASIIWDTRYGWQLDENGELVENNSVTVSAGLAF
ncbi:MAG: hypothetical protein GF344_13170 [Chitinivibrionales bacterium]|nr:hypothetical protein [Chitinivibrionales bacterium]MBD3357684.1 hypothetical protein [Chitinivibrionales bacterium]